MSTSERSPRETVRPQRRDAALNRGRIFVAARELFAEQGLEASLADIAERANVGLGTIYRNFKDKDDLVASLLDEKLAVIATIVDDVESLETGWRAFCALVERLIESFVADRSLEEIMLSEEGHRYAREALAHLAPGATRIMDRAKREDSLRHDIEFNDLPMILVMVKGSAQVGAPVDTEVWRRYLQIVLSGLATHAEQVELDTPPLSDEQLRVLSSIPPLRRIERLRPRRATTA